MSADETVRVRSRPRRSPDRGGRLRRPDRRAARASTVWTDDDLAQGGIPVVDVPFVTVGGGIGSFVTVDYLRIAGVPASSIRVLGANDSPVVDVRVPDPHLPDPADRAAAVGLGVHARQHLGLPELRLARGVVGEGLKAASAALERRHRADPHRLLDAAGRPGLRGPGAGVGPDRLRRHASRRAWSGWCDVALGGGYFTVLTPPAGDVAHEAGRLPEPLRPPRRRLPGAEVPAGPPGVPRDLPGLRLGRERLRAARARVRRAASGGPAPW